MPEVDEEPRRTAVVMETLPLFDMKPVPVPVPVPEPEPALSAQRRRTIRQLAALRNGRHPIGLCFGFTLRLHPDAPPADDREAPGPRCGSCRFREPWGAHSFPKCLRGEDGGDAPFASHGASSDCRAWWPACERWESRS